MLGNLQIVFESRDGEEVRECGKQCPLCPVLQLTSRRTILHEIDCESHNLVYHYICNCGVDYVGKTTGMLTLRFQQHIKWDPKSEVREHRKICQQEFKFEVLETVDDEDIFAKEHAWILALKPRLNKDLTSGEVHLCALYKRDMMKEKKEFINFDVNENEEDDSDSDNDDSDNDHNENNE